jgi:DNA-binding CsgD family transcriptional regulator
MAREGKYIPRPPSRLGSIGVRGTKHPLHILTEDIVQQIRRGTDSDMAWAKRMGCSPSTILKARRRLSWKWV